MTNHNVQFHMMRPSPRASDKGKSKNLASEPQTIQTNSPNNTRSQTGRWLMVVGFAIPRIYESIILHKPQATSNGPQKNKQCIKPPTTTNYQKHAKSQSTGNCHLCTNPTFSSAVTAICSHCTNHRLLHLSFQPSQF